MRSEKEMLRLIVDIAEKDSKIRAAYLEGSRVNPHVKKDRFQDYDVVYIVTDTKPYREEKEWINQFGERLYMQYPEEYVYEVSDIENSYGWLIQFVDGNRLDLHVCTEHFALEHLEMYKTLVDKEGILPYSENISDHMYWLKKPTQAEWGCTCNEFWWCLNNVAKGLWRNEMPYVMEMIDFNVRPMLRRLVEWKIGTDTNFSANVGKSAKYMNQFITRELYETYLKTYAVAEADQVWDAIYIACELFNTVAIEVSIKLGYVYDIQEAENSYNYLKYVRNLSRDLEE